MGIFDAFKNNNSSGVFICPPEEKPIKPDAFGFWSVGWAHEQAHKMLATVQEESKNYPLLCLSSFLSYLQLVALFTAINWAYAIFILRVPEECVKEMNVGFEDAIAALTNPDGTPISDDLQKYTKGSYYRYFKAIESDLLSLPNTDPSVYNPDVSELSSKFIEMIETCHVKDEHKITEQEKIHLKFMVASFPPDMFKTYQGQGWRYSA